MVARHPIAGPPVVMECASTGRPVMAHGRVRLEGGRLRWLRLERGLTLDQLAALTAGRIPARQLLEYEAGRRRCDPARFAQLCRALGVAPSALAAVGVEEAELADLRHWAGLTADEAAERLGLSQWSLLRAERSGRLPRAVARAVFVRSVARVYRQPQRVIAAALRRAESRASDPI
ncbi:helix-turn-helix domain-containing protein [Actinomadura sp. 21ATH]|uniref:helix-turn-helix domain-containing protein n=1 Tax=Actinomadura sp. 21ATH TaxID=1735444 RepID=UPI0035C1574D